MIQRYSFGRCKLHFDPHVCRCGKVPHPSGDYVLFADHEAEVADLQAQLSSTIQQHEDAAVEIRTKYEALRAEVVRRSAPVSMDEIPVGERIGAVRFNRIIAARAEPQKEATAVQSLFVADQRVPPGEVRLGSWAGPTVLSNAATGPLPHDKTDEARQDAAKQPQKEQK